MIYFFPILGHWVKCTAKRESPKDQRSMTAYLSSASASKKAKTDNIQVTEDPSEDDPYADKGTDMAEAGIDISTDM